MSRTDELTSRADDLFRVVASCNLGIRRSFFELSNLIPHATFRPASPGRSFKVPAYVVTIEGARAPVAHLTAATERVLADDVHDLVVWIQVAAHDPRRERLENEWGPDPRVRIASEASALDEFPVAAFHVTLPVGVRRTPYPRLVSSAMPSRSPRHRLSDTA